MTNENGKQGEARRETFGARAVVWARRLDWAAIFASAASVAIFLFAGVGAALLCLATPGGNEGGFAPFVAATLLSCVRAAVGASAVAWGALALRCAASFCAFFRVDGGGLGAFRGRDLLRFDERLERLRCFVRRATLALNGGLTP